MMTVSLALRGGPGSRRMSPETRERVLSAAKDLRYAPNARARALRLGRTNVIGLYAGYGFVNVRTPFFTEIVSGLQEGCEQVKKDLLLHGIFHGKSSEDIYSELLDGRIDGLVASMPLSDPLAQRLASSVFSVVAIADPIPGIPAVVVDDEEGSRLTAEHLRELGHRKVAYALSQTQPASAQRRHQAFLEASRNLGLEVTTYCSDWEQEDGRFARQAVTRGETAVACWNDTVAHYLLAACRECGVKVPQELAITGFDGCPTPFLDPFPLTTVVAPWSEVARTAMHRLDALLKGEPVEHTTRLPVLLRRGATT